MAPYYKSRLGYVIGALTLSLCLFALSLGYWLANPADAAYPVFSGERTIGNRGAVVYGGEGIAEDSKGDIFIGNTSGTNTHITKTDADGNFIKHIGKPGRENGTFSSTTTLHLTVDSEDNLWVSDSGNHTLQKFDNDGNFILRIGNFNTPSTADGGFRSPRGIDTDTNNNIYVADHTNNRIQKFDKDGNFLMKIGGTSAGSGNTAFRQPTQIAIDDSGNIYVGDSGNNRIQKLTSGGTYIATLSQGPSGLLCPQHPVMQSINGMDFDQSGDLLISTAGTATCVHSFIYRFVNDSHTQTIPHGLDGRSVSDFTISSDGSLLVRARFSIEQAAIYRLATDGTVIDSFGSGLEPGDLRGGPRSMAEDSDGNLFVVNSVLSKVDKFGPDGTHLASTQTIPNHGPGFYATTVDDVAVDSEGIVYVSLRATSSGGQTIYKFANDGSTIGTLNLTGGAEDYGPWGVQDMEFDSDDNLYVHRRGGSRIIDIFNSQTGQHIGEIGIRDGSTFGEYAPTRTANFDIFNDDIYMLEPGSQSHNPNQVRVFSRDNQPLRTVRLVTDGAGTGFKTSTNFDLNMDSFGNFYVYGSSTPLDQRITVFSHQGEYLQSIPGTYNFYPYGANNTFTSREFDFYVSKLSNEIMTNGDFDYIKIIPVSHLVYDPSQPLNLTVTSPTSSQLQINWNPPTSDGGDPITKYDVAVKSSSTDDWINVASVDAETTSYTAHVTKGNYDVLVTATTRAGTSPPATVMGTSADALYTLESMTSIEGLEGTSGFSDIGFDDEDNMYAVTGEANEIRKYNKSGDLLYTATNDDACALLHITVGNDRIYAYDWWCGGIYAYDTSGNFIETIDVSESPSGNISTPMDIAIEDSGTILVVDAWYRVLRFSSDWDFIEHFAPEIDSPTAITVDESGNIFIANDGNSSTHGIYKYSSTGEQLAYFGAPVNGSQQFYSIQGGLIIDSQGNIVANDVDDNRILIFGSDGTPLDIYGLGYDDTDANYLTFADGVGIAMASDGKLYVGDNWTTNPTYRVFTPTFDSDDGGNPTDPDPITNPPTAPTNLEPIVSSPEQITITWDPPSDDGGSPITGYQIRYRLVGQSDWHSTTTRPTSRTVTLDDLAVGDYEVQIIATNANGDGPAAELNFSVEADGEIEPGEPTYPDESDGDENSGDNNGGATGDDSGGLPDTGVNLVAIGLLATVLIGGGAAVIIRQRKLAGR